MAESDIVRTNTQSSGVPAFIADCHLGKLAKYLRLFGFDTLYFNSIDDDDLIAMANKEGRTILTRDRALYERGEASCLYLKPRDTRGQLELVIAELGLKQVCRPFVRCLVCNTPLQPIDKDAVANKVPPKVARFFDTFEICPVCDKVFWHGDHYKRMRLFVEAVLQELSV
ncbi:MAG: Mut7-C RNAse domain-containing protein [Sulfurimonadaceae bacterium]|nr:Mut7-C RNAse domain-containing protein [Sulfurimonadaceae bacterium]